ncbi:MAG TPA: GTP cyclohydrolase II [Xanthobacteraceae bacterium]|jgi:GTP cyclohydrolase II|nr:GTP cyclohydrolase II [Xanthobacteraceae bacterium]
MGSPEHVAVERALSEFRCGRPVIFTAVDEPTIALPVDGMSDDRLTGFRQLCAGAPLKLVITGRRASSLGLVASGPIAIAVREADRAADILSLAVDAQVERSLEASAPGAAAGPAIELAKLAQRLPALLIAPTGAAVAASDPPLIAVGAAAVALFREAALGTLTVASEAQVPLNGGRSARFVVFRDVVGGTATAVIVGAPDFLLPVPVRMHSACLTGDVFGSRRCDCGDQLRLALARLDEEGGGIILYLRQEGRGLGLANKMRAYQLQDEGLDTLDANATLGFDDDERDYGIAVRMLELLGCKRVLLLTNNPAKLDGLARAGIEVSGRIPLQGAINADNRRYLTAKATRAGHKLDDLMTVLAEDEQAGDNRSP